MRRTLVGSMIVLLLGLAVGSAVPAGAESVLERAAGALRRDPVYADPAAERRLASEEADRLRTAIRDGDEPVFVAVLPAAAADEAGGDVAGLPGALGERVGLPGTYAVVAARRG